MQLLVILSVKNLKEKTCFNLPGSYICRAEYSMGNLVIDLPGGIARSNSTLDRLQEKNHAASRLKSRLENVIRKRLQNPRGRCVSKNIELEDLNALKWSKSLPEMRKCLIRRVEKMYTFCHEQKAQKAKSIISRVVKNLERLDSAIS